MSDEINKQEFLQNIIKANNDYLKNNPIQDNHVFFSTHIHQWNAKLLTERLSNVLSYKNIYPLTDHNFYNLIKDIYSNYILNQSGEWPRKLLNVFFAELNINKPTKREYNNMLFSNRDTLRLHLTENKRLEDWLAKNKPTGESEKETFNIMKDL